MSSSQTQHQIVILTTNPAGTAAVASEFACFVAPPALIGLSGPLGAGKTEFTRGFCAAFGAESAVCSPTFVLENVYPTQLNPGGSSVLEICHWDLYRLEGRFDLRQLSEIADDPSRLCLVEWPEKVPDLSPLIDYHVHIDYVRADGSGDGEQRRLTISGRLVSAQLCAVLGRLNAPGVINITIDKVS